MRDKTAICNGALDELPAAPIQSIDDPDDTGARACKRRYGPVFADLIDEHPYDAAIARTIGAAVGNERSGEWRFAYQMPSEARSLLRILPDYASHGAVATIEVPLAPGQRGGIYTGYFPHDVGVAYIVAGNTIFCNQEAAVIEFIAEDPPLAAFSSLFHRAFELELAARICMPVLKSKTRQRELIGAAEVARQRARADDLNNSPMRYDRFASEAAVVRGASMGGWYQ